MVSSSSYLKEIKCLFENGNFEKGIELYETYVSKVILTNNLNYNIALVYRFLDNTDMAEIYFSKAYNSNIFEYLFFIDYYEILLKNGKYSKAGHIKYEFKKNYPFPEKLSPRFLELESKYYSNKKIAFYVVRELHLPIILPVYDAYKELFPQFKIGIISPDYKSISSGILQQGISETLKKELKKQGYYFWDDDTTHIYDVVVFSDLCFWYIDGYGPIINIGHGMISKGVYFTDKPISRRENYASTLCVPGNWYQHSYGDQVFTKIATTGFSKLDKNATYTKEDKRIFFSKIGFSDNITTILFAPTFNVELTGMYDLAEEWLNPLAKPFQILIKLHGVAPKDISDIYQKIASLNPNIYFVEDYDSTFYQYCADLLVSDISSIYLEYLLYDKPIVVYDNPLYYKFSKYNRENVEYKVRSVFYIFNDPCQMWITINKALQNDSKQKMRNFWKSQLYSDVSYSSSYQIAHEIKSLAMREMPKGKLTIIVESLENNITTKNLEYARISTYKYYTCLDIYNKKILQDNFNESFVFIKGDYLLPKNWYRLLEIINYFYNDHLISLRDLKKDTQYSTFSHQKQQQNILQYDDSFWEKQEPLEFLIDGLVVPKGHLYFKEILALLRSKQYQKIQQITKLSKPIAIKGYTGLKV